MISTAAISSMRIRKCGYVLRENQPSRRLPRDDTTRRARRQARCVAVSRHKYPTRPLRAAGARSGFAHRRRPRGSHNHRDEFGGCMAGWGVRGAAARSGGWTQERGFAAAGAAWYSKSPTGFGHKEMCVLSDETRTRNKMGHGGRAGRDKQETRERDAPAAANRGAQRAAHGAERVALPGHLLRELLLVVFHKVFVDHDDLPRLWRGGGLEELQLGVEDRRKNVGLRRRERLGLGKVHGANRGAQRAAHGAERVALPGHLLRELLLVVVHEVFVDHDDQVLAHPQRLENRPRARVRNHQRGALQVLRQARLYQATADPARPPKNKA
eukprot:CAMPEP_0174912452 /NCGR_PEP_ID=MMETSP0167-20121228/79791_1 /TAXON_ID=38298 /ORGANISM="Rhodella maculata, Strain CCMP736" /LENGTH=325 /DNA_ID=CAMNT_0016157101 /DNA_START=182 /DNA_END=1158 /DNA_ORIENTATION=+